MTIIISVKINDGIVMASDSASTFEIGQTYLHADKILNLVKGLPIGAMVTGAGGIGSESISTLLKDFRSILTVGEGSWKPIHEAPYQISDIAARVQHFLMTKVLAQDADVWLKLRLCGYSSGRPLPEIWEVNVNGRSAPEPSLIQGEDSFGPRWDGEYEPLNRLLLGVSTGLEKALAANGLEEMFGMIAASIGQEMGLFYLNAMPVQDAIDLSRWLVQVTAGYIRFNIKRQPKVVGGSTEIATITKHEGFRWIERRHFYRSELNP